MIVSLAIGVVAVVAIGVAVFYRAAFRNAERVICSLRLANDLDRNIAKTALKAGRELSLQVRVLTKERDALIAELLGLKTSVPQHESTVHRHEVFDKIKKGN